MRSRLHPSSMRLPSYEPQVAVGTDLCPHHPGCQRGSCWTPLICPQSHPSEASGSTSHAPFKRGRGSWCLTPPDTLVQSARVLRPLGESSRWPHCVLGLCPAPFSTSLAVTGPRLSFTVDSKPTPPSLTPPQTPDRYRARGLSPSPEATAQRPTASWPHPQEPELEVAGVGGWKSS